MPRNLKYLDQILAFKTFVPCFSCHRSCDTDPIVCNICCKWYHRKCLKKPMNEQMSKRVYNELTAPYSYKVFICNRCHNSVMPFSNVDDIEVVSTHFGNGQNICKKCKRGANFQPEVDYIQESQIIDNVEKYYFDDWSCLRV